MRLEELIFTYSQAMKQKYGVKVFRVGLSTGTICPHRKNGGCIFCNPDSFRGNYQTQQKTIEEQLLEGKDIIQKNSKAEKFVAYFQDETSTAGELSSLKEMFEAAASDPDVLELVVSTRPDYIDEKVLSVFKDIKIPVRIEIGMQSMHDRSLNFLNRGHDFESVQKALNLCEDMRITSGVHLIMGIPGESVSEMQETIKWVSEQRVIKEIKLHNLVIYKGTRLAEMWQHNLVKQMKIDDYIDILCEIIPFIRKDMIVSRLFTSNILHNDLAVEKLSGNKTKWMNRLRLKLIEKGISQGSQDQL